MMQYILARILCFIVLAPTLTWAQEIRAEDVTAFVERSYARYHSSDSDLETVLWRIARANPSPDATVAAFAKQLGLSEKTASAYAVILMESAAVESICFQDTPPCSFERGGRLQGVIERAAAIDESGRVLAAVARSLFNLGIDRGAAGAAFINVVSAHPGSAVVFRSLLDYCGGPLYFAGMLATMANFDEKEIIAGTAGLDFHGRMGERQGWAEAMLESAELDASHTASPALRAALAQLSILVKLKGGLNGEALAHYDGLPVDVRALLPLPKGLCAPANSYDCKQIERDGYRLVDELAAALALAGRRQQAVSMLQRRVDGAAGRVISDAQRHEALVDALVPKLSRESLFDLFIRGRLPGQPAPQDDSDEAVFHGPGWLFKVNAAAPALRRVVATRLRTAGYADMALFLDESPLPLGRFEREEAFEALASLFPVHVRERRAAWQRRIEMAAISRAPTYRGSTRTRIMTRDLPPWWVERRLPEGTQPWRESDVAATPPQRLALPVDPAAVVRYERFADEHALIYQSADYDLPGEIPALGLWFVTTAAGKWGRPVYLGLQQHFPYFVTPSSRLAMLAGDLLRLEVQVQEIDSSTITFPPLALGIRRSDDGVYLEIDLSRLLADQDGDGLTDVEESRLGLDLRNPDTDGDGMRDGVDPLPLTAFRANAARSSTLAHAILSQLVDHDALAIVVPAASGRAELLDALGTAKPPGVRHPAVGATFLVADPALFAGVTTSSRLLIYSNADLEALQRGTAPFYPPRIDQLFSSIDGRTHYVSWSTGWSGGVFIATCRPSGGCDIDVVMEWVS